MTSDRENSSEQPLVNRGVYTLANDAVIEWFQAFIRSFRRTNPILPLTVIPYDQDISRIQALREQFHFEIMDESRCSQYDALAGKVKVIKKEAGCFRKFACFYGKYREFLLLDADIVTLVSLDRLFQAFSNSSSQFVFFDTAMDMCYTENLAAVMVPQYGSPAYNSGAFFSRHGLIAESEIFTAAERAATICDGFAIGGEQPFLNYVTDISRLRYANFDDFAFEFAPIIWARQPFTYDSKTNRAINDEGKLMPFIHWAGCSYPNMVRPEVFLHHRTRGLSFAAAMLCRTLFGLRRCQIYFLKMKARGNMVMFKFITSKDWRAFYIKRLIGINTKLPM